MIAPKGFTSLFQLTRERMDGHREAIKTKMPFESWKSLIYPDLADGNWNDLPRALSSYREMSHFTASASAARELWALLTDNCGACVFTDDAREQVVGSKVFDPLEEEDLCGLYVHLSVGTIGSGLVFRKPLLENETGTNYLMFRRMRSVLHRPICLPERSIARLERVIFPDERSVEEAGLEGDIVDEIVRRFDSGEPVKKQWVRENLCRDMKYEIFLMLWRAAAERRPELSKPGPKSQAARDTEADEIR